jgi:hypothetical protein
MEWTVHEGGCHCGTLRYALMKPPLRTVVCHCTDCQRISGSAFGISVVCLADAVSISGRAKFVSRILGSGGAGNRWTCPDCGVWICGDAKEDLTTKLVRRTIRGGTLDDRSWLKPDAHIWARSAQPWVTLPNNLPVHQMGMT